ncbi:MAG TPA: hypothetical protein VFV50_11840 [Bdellovibrionales bacterium]|nr:hypothetical protein [Bdellovibrionales bacterium]
MKLKPRDARFLSDLLPLPIALRQRLALAASDHEDLSIDDVDQLLEVSGRTLSKIKFDDEGNPTEAGRQLEKLIEELRYA